MKKIMIVLVLALMTTISSAHPIKNKEKKEARKEHRLAKKKFDNRTKEQKTKDLKMVSLIAVLGIIVFKGMQE